MIRNARTLDTKNIKKARTYNRKSKSLEELSKKFLNLFIEKEEHIISLDDITLKLGFFLK